jgi:hypothetical protein
MCRVVDTVLADQETIYAPRHSNERSLFGLKGSLNEYELDLLRQRSLLARYEKARRGELVVVAPVGRVSGMRRIRIGACKERSLWFLTRSRNLESRGRRSFGSMSITSRRTATPSGGGRVTSLFTRENPVYGGAYAYGRTAITGYPVKASARRSAARRVLTGLR